MTVQNTSTVAVINVSAALPPELADVTQDASGCANLAASSRCELKFTSSVKKHTATSVNFAGDNTNTVTAPITVNAPWVTNGMVLATALDAVNNLIYSRLKFK